MVEKMEEWEEKEIMNLSPANTTMTKKEAWSREGGRKSVFIYFNNSKIQLNAKHKWSVIKEYQKKQH
jgi:hypothetical protein